MHDSALEPEASIDLPGSNGDRGLGDGPLENGDDNAESQYAPISNQPPLGQICRYVHSYGVRVCNLCLWSETDKWFLVIAALLAHLFGADRQMVRLSATLADYTQRHAIHHDQQI